jgi:hypothetical protein
MVFRKATGEIDLGWGALPEARGCNEISLITQKRFHSIFYGTRLYFPQMAHRVDVLNLPSIFYHVAQLLRNSSIEEMLHPPSFAEVIA